MSAIFKCDACGKEEPAEVYPHGVFKPRDWYTRYDEKTGRQDACSRACVDALAARTGVTRAVLPI